MDCRRTAAAIFCTLVPVLCVRASTEVPAPEADRTVRIAVQSNLDPGFFIDAFAPTMRYLRQCFPATRFVSSQLTLDELTRAVETGTTDLVFTDSGIFSVLQRAHGATQIAARLTEAVRNPRQAAAMAVVVKAGSGFHALRDLEGKRIAAESPEDAGTWLAFLSAALKEGADRAALEKRASFTRYELPGPLLLVAADAADAAVVSACTLESLESSRLIEPGTLRVLQAESDETFPCRYTGRRFPGIIFGATETVDPDFLKALTVAVLTYPGSRVGNAWGPVNDFSAIDDVYRSLAVGPYAYLAEPNWQALLREIRVPAAVVLLLLLFWGFHTVRTNALVERRTRELTEAQKALEANRDRLYVLERAGIVSGLSSMLVHELRQPLAALVAYAGGLLMYLKNQEKTDPTVRLSAESILEESRRIDAIIEHVRGYAKSSLHPRREVTIGRLTTDVRQSMAASGRYARVPIREELNGAENTVLIVEPLEAELALLNLLKNAARASLSTEDADAKVTVRVVLTERTARFLIDDEGPVPTEETLRIVANPSKSSDAEGLGLGILIVRRIAESHGGSLSFEPAPLRGLRAVLEFPLPAKGASSC